MAAAQVRRAARNAHSPWGTEMLIRASLVALAILTSAAAWADYDPALEAQEKAQRDAAQKAARENQRQVQKLKDEATARSNKEQMAAKRKTLGAAAQGKSDADVDKLYAAKIKSDTDAAYRTADEAKRALSSGQGAAALKQTTGKSMKEIQNMSDAELDALSRDMEKKYGK
jgi:hypothetical protein